MKFRWLWISLPLSIIAGCIPLTPGNTSSTPSRSLGIVIHKDISVTDPRMVTPVFGEGDAAGHMYRLFALNLPSVLLDSSGFDSVYIIDSISDSLLVPTKLHWRRKDTLSLQLPDHTKPSIVPADFTLFIQDVSFSGKALFKVFFLFSGRGIFNIKPMTCRASYTLWDNKNGEAVSWGKIKIGGRMIVTKCEWVSLINEFAGKTVENTPYDAPPRLYSTSEIDSYKPKMRDCNLKK